MKRDHNGWNRSVPHRIIPRSTYYTCPYLNPALAMEIFAESKTVAQIRTGKSAEVPDCALTGIDDCCGEHRAKGNRAAADAEGPNLFAAAIELSVDGGPFLR